MYLVFQHDTIQTKGTEGEIFSMDPPESKALTRRCYLNSDKAKTLPNHQNTSWRNPTITKRLIFLAAILPLNSVPLATVHGLFIILTSFAPVIVTIH